VRLEQVDPATFLDDALDMLLEDEARHNLMIGLAFTLRDQPELYPGHRLWLVRDGDEVLGAALRTPPHNLVVARSRVDEALGVLAELDDEPPGVVGAVPEVDEFAVAWSARTGVSTRRVRSMGLFALETVQPVPTPAGVLRDARADELDLILDWWEEFAREALGEEAPDREHARELVEHRLASATAGVVFWDEGGPVSLLSYGGQTPGGVRIGPVYTPPDLRGRGYATALTAQVSQQLLDGGRRFCFLYTDLANPTSNAIYERIGYVRVCDAAEVAFD
jgi:predicted GNAT family acetyltransferase